MAFKTGDHILHLRTAGGKTATFEGWCSCEEWERVGAASRDEIREKFREHFDAAVEKEFA